MVFSHIVHGREIRYLLRDTQQIDSAQQPRFKPDHAVRFEPVRIDIEETDWSINARLANWGAKFDVLLKHSGERYAINFCCFQRIDDDEVIGVAQEVADHHTYLSKGSANPKTDIWLYTILLEPAERLHSEQLNELLDIAAGMWGQLRQEAVQARSERL